MKSKYMLFLLLLIGIHHKLCAEPNTQTRFKMVPNNAPLFGNDYGFDLVDQFSVDSLNTEIETRNFLLKSQVISPYTYVRFNHLDEKQIDSLIHQIKDKSFIVFLMFIDCSIKKLPDSVKLFRNLYGIRFMRCNEISSLNGFNSNYSMFGLEFSDCKINKLPEGTEGLHSMLRLMLEMPDDYDGMDLNEELSKFSKRKNIVDLYVKYKLLKHFPKSILDLTMLQTLVFYNKDITDYPDNFDALVNLNRMFLTVKDFQKEDTIQNHCNSAYYTNLEFADDEQRYEEDKNFIINLGKGMFYPEIDMKKNDQISCEHGFFIVPRDSLYTYENDFGSYKFNVIVNSKSNYFIIKSLSEFAPTDNVRITCQFDDNDIFYNNAYKNEELKIDLSNVQDGLFFMIVHINSETHCWRIIKMD